MEFPKFEGHLPLSLEQADTKQEDLQALQTANATLALRVQELERERNVTTRVLIALLNDLNQARGNPPMAATIFWPSSLARLGAVYGIAIGKGKESFTPADRMRFLNKPKEEVDNAMLLQLVPLPTPPTAQPEPPTEPSKLVL